MSDLVERLRGQPTERTYDSVGRSYDFPKHLVDEAATEIEALRRELAGLKEYAAEKSNQHVAMLRENQELRSECQRKDKLLKLAVDQIKRWLDRPRREAE